MDNGMMPYDSRPASSAPLQRPMMAQQYMMNTPYSQAPLTTMAPPQYLPPASMSYESYHSPPAVMASPFKQQPHAERPVPPLGSPDQRLNYIRKAQQDTGEDSRDMATRNEPYTSAKPTKLQPIVTTRTSTPNPSAKSKTIIPNTMTGSQVVDFSTDVDVLMKAIQARPETDTLVKQAEEEHLTQSPLKPAPPRTDDGEVRVVLISGGRRN